MTATVTVLADWRATHPPAPRPAPEPVDYRLVWIAMVLRFWGMGR